MIKFTVKMPKSDASRRFFNVLIRVSVIFSATAVISVMAISMVNDALALCKPSRSVKISASDAKELAVCLENEGIIDHPWLFSVYANIKGVSDFNGVKEINVNSDMDYRQILAAFDEKNESSVIKISFPNGATTDEIIDIFVENGIGSREGFVEVINSYPFEYGFVTALEGNISEGRKYRLDGYLYPDTYDFYTGRSEVYYIYKLLDRFASVAEGLPKDNAYSLDQIVTLASMIQRSSSRVGQYEYVSAVFHNRLNAAEVYPYLDCPASSVYGKDGSGGIYAGAPTEEIKISASPYNTFLNKGLPPGAICNPDVNALICAIRPANVEYIYFVTAENGDVLFAFNEREHSQNLTKVCG